MSKHIKLKYYDVESNRIIIRMEWIKSELMSCCWDSNPTLLLVNYGIKVITCGSIWDLTLIRKVHTFIFMQGGKNAPHFPKINGRIYVHKCNLYSGLQELLLLLLFPFIL